MFMLSMVSCSGLRRVPAVVERVVRDTCRIVSLSYDSIHVATSHTNDYRRGRTQDSLTCPDTVVISDVRVEYRYRLLHDTVYRLRTDTVPHVVAVAAASSTPPRQPPWLLVLALALGALLAYCRLRKSAL